MPDKNFDASSLELPYSSFSLVFLKRFPENSSGSSPALILITIFFLFIQFGRALALQKISEALSSLTRFPLFSFLTAFPSHQPQKPLRHCANFNPIYQFLPEHTSFRSALRACSCGISHPLTGSTSRTVFHARTIATSRVRARIIAYLLTHPRANAMSLDAQLTLFLARALCHPANRDHPILTQVHHTAFYRRTAPRRPSRSPWARGTASKPQFRPFLTFYAHLALLYRFPPFLLKNTFFSAHDCIPSRECNLSSPAPSRAP
ncbi:MAG: hypothetical protein IJY43_06390 [Clostridia bacterium]|nr:hypothetical protein [Clostridia bacterium]